MKKIILLSCLILAIATSTFAQNKVEDEKVVFTQVEHEAEFSKGQDGWVKFLMKTLDANKPMKNNAPEGTYQVIIKFIVTRDGKVSDVQAETNHGYGMEAEAISVIKKSPDWKAAIQNGKPVNAFRRQPITFVVPPNKKTKAKRTDS